MKKPSVTLLCLALLAGATAVYAQTGGGTTDKTKTDKTVEKGGKKGKDLDAKKGHKGGKDVKEPGKKSQMKM